MKFWFLDNMKKFIFSTIGIVGLIFVFSGSVFIQRAASASSSPINSGLDDHTAREEAKGKEVWEKLQTKQITCADLSDDDFGVLGEYFMGQMAGTSHGAMNNMMIAMMGEEGEKQMHVAMGKRLSGCDTSAAYPSQGSGFLPMMQMMGTMMGGWSSPFSPNQSNNSMMNFGFGTFGRFSWVFLVLWWVLVIAGIVVFIKWVGSQFRGGFSRSRKISA